MHQLYICRRVSNVRLSLSFIVTPIVNIPYANQEELKKKIGIANVFLHFGTKANRM